MAFKKPLAIGRRREQIARRMEILRKKRGLLAIDIAKRLHISNRTYIRMRQGEVSIPAELLPEIAKILDTTVLYLYGVDVPVVQHTASPSHTQQPAAA